MSDQYQTTDTGNGNPPPKKPPGEENPEGLPVEPVEPVEPTEGETK